MSVRGVHGTPAFDTIAVAKIEIDYTKTPYSIDVQAAFINSQTNDLHGWTRGAVPWSEETKKLMNALRESMEQDLAGRHFVGGQPRPGPYQSSAADNSAPSGLGEHIGAVDTKDGVPSV